MLGLYVLYPCLIITHLFVLKERCTYTSLYLKISLISCFGYFMQNFLWPCFCGAAGCTIIPPGDNKHYLLFYDQFVIKVLRKAWRWQSSLESSPTKEENFIYRSRGTFWQIQNKNRIDGFWNAPTSTQAAKWHLGWVWTDSFFCARIH